MERWTPAYDRLFDPHHELAGDEPVCQRWAFLDLCHLAQWKGGTRVVAGKVVSIPRGSFLASVRFLAQRWGWSKSRVERFLAALKHPSVAKIEPVEQTRSGTVYRIVAYEDYANPWDAREDANKDANKDANRDANRDANEDGTETARGQKQPSSTRGTSTRSTSNGRKQPSYPSEFEEVWKAHPRGSKKHAYEQYRAVVPSEITKDELIRHLESYRATFTDGFQGQHLHRWIRDRRWEEIVEAPSSNGAQRDPNATQRWQALERLHGVR